MILDKFSQQEEDFFDATSNNDQNKVKAILDTSEININAITYDDAFTGLMIGCDDENLSLVRIFLEHESAKNMDYFNVNNSLMLSTCIGNLEIFKLLWNFKTKAITGKNEIIKNLYINRACSIEGYTVVMLASEGGHIEIVKAIFNDKSIKNKINLDIKNDYGETAEKLALENGHVEIVKLISEFRKNQSKKNYEVA